MDRSGKEVNDMYGTGKTYSLTVLGGALNMYDKESYLDKLGDVESATGRLPDDVRILCQRIDHTGEVSIHISEFPEGVKTKRKRFDGKYDEVYVVYYGVKVFAMVEREVNDDEG